jgi:micrococcal nuclease
MIRAVLLLALGVFGPSSALAETFNGGRAVIIDGDTFAIGSERVRILNIDAPETRGSRCERELVAGLKAKERLTGPLRAGSVDIVRDGEDRYRRTLARVSVGGLDVGSVLIGEGLALPWRDGPDAREARLQYWCRPGPL